VTGAEAVVRGLIEQGVQVVFGIPGALNGALYDALREHQDDLRHVLVRHECGGAFMADGYARVSGDVGVCVTVPGPGATHAASGIAGAFTDCVPVLLVTTSSETRWRGARRRDLFHGLDQQALFAPITKWSAQAQSSAEIPELLAEAFRQLRHGRPGPVHLEVPADLLEGNAGAVVPARVTRDRSPADLKAIERAAVALLSARRPLLLGGAGVLHSGAWTALGEVASALRAPVITTVQGKGAIPDDHPWSLGDMNSVAGRAAYPMADLVFAVGCRFAQVDTRWPWFTPPPRLVHLDADPAEVGRLYPPEVGLAGDVETVLRQLLGDLSPGSSPGSAAILAACRRDAGAPGGGEKAAGADWETVIPELHAKRQERALQPVIAVLKDTVGPDDVAAFDVCVPGYHSRWDWPARAPRSYLYPGVYVGMGYGYPAALGAQLARPERGVLAICGDGGFQMTMAELGTAMQEQIPVVAVVVNDEGLSLIRTVQDRQFGGRRFAVDLRNPSFAALAQTYGIETAVAREPEALTAAARRFLERRKPALIEVLGEWIR
jgi:thiamine pyrophosphate-dependent acetolactate synthase large subunit-like protein